MAMKRIRKDLNGFLSKIGNRGNELMLVRLYLPELTAIKIINFDVWSIQDEIFSQMSATPR